MKNDDAKKLGFIENETFVNPYNFVSTSFKVKREENKEVSDSLSGVMHCTLKVKQYLSIPDVHENDKSCVNESDKSCVNERDESCYKFYTIGGVPTIPGSELRGCIRAVYETITDSCFSIINNNILTARLSVQDANKYSYGVLQNENGKWELYEAKVVKTNKEGKWVEIDANGKRKYINNGEERIKSKDAIKRIWLDLRGNRETIMYFFKQPSIVKYGDADMDEAIENYFTICNMYYDNAAGEKSKEKKDKKADEKNKAKKEEKEDRNSKFLKSFSTYIKDKNTTDPIPVFYSVEEPKSGKNRLHIAPAQVSRKIFKNSVKSLLGEAAPCNGEKGYCPACRLFGTINEKSAIASRVRFGDAKPVENDILVGEFLPLSPLLSPKISSNEFYSFCGDYMTEAEKWNYDTDGVQLRGRKFYFHSVYDKNKMKNSGNQNLDKKVQSVKPGSKFEFDIYFDKISRQELNELVWAVTLGENDIESNQMHKLGHAKPLGLGSVKIVVDSIKSRSYDKNTHSYSINDEEIAVDASCVADPYTKDDLLDITNYEYVKDKNVTYPIAHKGKDSKNDEASHLWFSKNRANGDIYHFVLPFIDDGADDLELPAFCQKNAPPPKNSKGKGGKNNYNKNRNNNKKHW